MSESLDFDSVKGAKKPRSNASRKPRIGSSQTSLSDYAPEFLSPSSSFPCEIPRTHNVSSSKNLSRFSTDDNGYARAVSEMKNTIGGGSAADYHQWETSQGLGHFKGGGCRNDSWTCESDGTRSTGDTYLAGTFDGIKLSKNQDKDCKGATDLKLRGDKINLGDKFQQKPDRFSDALEWNLDMDDFEKQRMGNLKGLDIKRQDLKRLHQTGDSTSQGNRPTKVKLKVGDMTHTIHANYNEGSTMRLQVPVGSFSKPHERSSDIRPKLRLISKENSENKQDRSPRVIMGGLAACKSWTDVRHIEGSRSKSSEEIASSKRINNHVAYLATSQPVRKSSRVPKRRVLDMEESDDDNEYGGLKGEDYDEEAPKRRSSRIPKRKVVEGEFDDQDGIKFSVRGNKNSKKKLVVGKVSANFLDDNDESAASGDEDSSNSDIELDAKKTKSIKQELIGSFVNDKKEVPLTARQQALQSVKVAVNKVASKFIELPDGLPQSAQKKQKGTMPDMERQLKKAEAAQQRRMQVEKASKEIQAEAIRKILGHDSNRELRKEKLHKKQTKIAKEKAAASMGLGSNTVRWVMGPTGTIVSFSEDAGLPSIFKSTTRGYPPLRERCAGPSCTNTYKYRDSKSNLPLCSLQCYRAVNDRIQSVTT